MTRRMTKSAAWIVPGYNSGVSRRVYIDWARGIAVLVMIWAHTMDAWTRAADRHGVAYRDAAVLGGFAAPLFLWLAGLAVVLAATRAAERPDPAAAPARRSSGRARGVEVACRRGLEIFILAFLFRLQGFIVTPGGSPVTLFRVDVLNIMGPAMVGVGLLWGAGRTVAARVVSCAVAAARDRHADANRAHVESGRRASHLAAVVHATGRRPDHLYVVSVGGIRLRRRCGRRVARGDEGPARGAEAAPRPGRIRRGPHRVRVLHGRPAVDLPCLVVLDQLADVVRDPRRDPDGGAVGDLSHVSQSCERRALSDTSAIDPLARLGRSSLFIYWIHVELVYGYATWLIRGRLPLWGVVAAFAAFCAAMYGAIVLRDRLVDGWRIRRLRQTAQTATV